MDDNTDGVKDVLEDPHDDVSDLVDNGRHFDGGFVVTLRL